MEHIRQAIERARELQGAGTQQTLPVDQVALRPQTAVRADAASTADPHIREIVLKSTHLESHRLIAHDYDDRRSRSFDVLRTQVLQSMDANGHQLLAVTSPGAGCGKTLTAINLALSIARHPERTVVLVDMDLQKPQVANCLGLPCEQGLFSVLQGRITLANAMVEARIGAYRLTVLPSEGPVSNSSEWMASAAMSTVLQELKRGSPTRIIILDMAPILLGDDVISVLPQIDCALFVVAVGTSMTAEIKECSKHLQSIPIVRTVVNKVAGIGPIYY